MNINGKQLDLLSTVPVSRSTDADSSHLAEAEINCTGSRAIQQHAVLAAVRQTPGMTAREISFSYDIDRYVVSRRLPELVGKVCKGQIRSCMVGGRKSLTWYPIENPGTNTGTGA